ncbi:acyl-CoA synthetase [Marinactinospora endophytica]
MADPARRVAQWLAAYDTAEASVAHLLCDRHDGDSVALTEIGPDLVGRDLTYGELAHRSSALAQGLAGLGVGPGGRVATLVGKGHDLAVAALAIWRLGAVMVPLFTGFAPSAIALRLRGSAATVVIADDDQRPKLDPGEDIPAAAPWRVVTTGPAPLRPGDTTTAELSHGHTGLLAPAATGGHAPFIQIHTSGSAGPPTSVDVPVRALAAFHAYHHYGLDARPDDVYWNATDPGWAYGLYYGLVSPLLTGQRSLHLRAGFDPELTLEVLETFAVTNFTAAPTVYRALRSTVKTLPPGIVVRHLSSTGEPLTPEITAWAHDTFGVAVHDHYGQTEIGMCAGVHNHPDLAGAGPAMTALPGFDVRVLDPLSDSEAAPGAFGRLAVRVDTSPAMWFTGYHEGPLPSSRRFSPDGRWYLTGDTGTRDQAAGLSLFSRDDDVILTSGYRVGPYDVESALLHHPAVAEVAVHGEPDELRGRIIAARVVLNDGFSPSDELAARLQDTVETRFAAHARPHRIIFVDALPKTPSGKIQRLRLRA